MAPQRRKGQQTVVVDGFTTIKAAQRAVDKRKTEPSSPKPVPAPEPPRKQPETAESAQQKTRIGHTAQPSRHEVVCFECGYEFFLTGRLNNVYCPKCRSMLEAGDLTIEGEWSGQAKTVGTVHVKPEAVVRGGRIVAGNMVLAGKIAGGKVEIVSQLEISGKGAFIPGLVELTDLAIGQDADVEFAGEFNARNIVIAGRLKAVINAGGLITIRAGGFFRGEARSRRLVLEDGGGLNAKLAVTAG